MKRTFGIVCLFLCAWPPAVVAQSSRNTSTFAESEAGKVGAAPETFMHPDTIAYFRYDGMASHRKGFEKTVLGNLLMNELSEFIHHLGEVLDKAAKKQLIDSAPEAPSKLFRYFLENGVVVGLQVQGKLKTYEAEFVMSFPNGAKRQNREAVISMVKAFLERPKVEKEVFTWPKVEKEVFTLVRGGRTVNGIRLKDAHSSSELTYMGWWEEGDDIILAVSTKKLEGLVARADRKAPNLLGSKRFKKFRKDNGYETVASGFLDIEQTTQLLVSANEMTLTNLKERLQLKLMLTRLGVYDLKMGTFHFGFQDKYLRTTLGLELTNAKERRGLLRLVSAPKKLDPKTLPPIPEDATLVGIHHFDWLEIYDEVTRLYQLVEVASKLGGGEQLQGLPKSPGEFLDKALGFDFRNDFLAALDPLTVTYRAYSEGPFFLGRAIAVKVKDEKKLQKVIDKLLGLANEQVAGSQVQVMSRKYHDGMIHVLRVPEMPVAPSYTFHKGWFVVGISPVIPQGFILRSDERLERWQSPDVLKRAIASGKKTGNKNTRLGFIRVTDPGPMLRTIMPLVPILIAAANSQVGPADGIDLSKVPHPSVLTKDLTPNVSLFFDDGDGLRIEWYTTVPSPNFSSLYFLAALGDLTAGWEPLQRTPDLEGPGRVPFEGSRTPFSSSGGWMRSEPNSTATYPDGSLVRPGSVTNVPPYGPYPSAGPSQPGAYPSPAVHTMPSPPIYGVPPPSGSEVTPVPGSKRTAKVRPNTTGPTGTRAP
ncbi:MAG: hypothetical protein ACFCD0_10085, partial [Gemmataceae bacterium]